MRMTLYRSIIRQAISITWQYKYLWFFGLFATLLASNFEVELVSRFLTQNSAPSYSWQGFMETGLFSNQAWNGFMEVAQTSPSSFVGILILLLVLGMLAVALLWLSITSQVALVSNTNKALNGANKKTPQARHAHDVSIGIKEGSRYFWPVLLLNFGVRIAVFLLAYITIVPFLIWASAQGFGFGITYLIIFIVFLAIALSLALIARYAIAGVVLDGLGIKTAIVKAWHLFWKNWLVSLEMGFILFAISLLSTFAIMLAVLIIAIPFIVLYLITLYFNLFILWVGLLLLAILVSVAVVIIGGSMVTVFQTTSWVGLYNQLTSKAGVTSKLERMFGR